MKNSEALQTLLSSSFSAIRTTVKPSGKVTVTVRGSVGAVSAGLVVIKGISTLPMLVANIASAIINRIKYMI